MRNIANYGGSPLKLSNAHDRSRSDVEEPSNGGPHDNSKTAEEGTSRSSRRVILTGMLLLTALIATDQTIVATALPTIVSSLGGFTLFPWIFAAYLLTMAVTIPLYGKLADQFGRKRLVVFGSVLFLCGSVLCGFSWNIASLIVFRAVQGIGAGAVRPLTMTIIGDLYTTEERGKIQGLIAGVWGLSAIGGPLVGGLFAQFASWRWIFYVNIPIGIPAVALVWVAFRERAAGSSSSVDFLGAALLSVGAGALILTLLQPTEAWKNPQTIATAIASLVVLAFFVLWERRATNPIFPLWVFKNRTLSGTVFSAAIVGLLTIGMSAYIPTLVQGVYGGSPLVAGAILGLMSIGWPLSSSLSGRLYGRIGFRDTTLVGIAFVLVATAACAFATWGIPVVYFVAPTFVLALGLGFVSTPLVVGAQSMVDWGRRGAVTGAVTFGQMFGSTLSTAIFGAVFNARLAHWLGAAPPAVRAVVDTPDRAASLLRRIASVPPMLVGLIRGGVFEAVHSVLICMFAAAVLGAILLIVMPRKFEQITEEQRSAGNS